MVDSCAQQERGALCERPWGENHYQILVGGTQDHESDMIQERYESDEWQGEGEKEEECEDGKRDAQAVGLNMTQIVEEEAVDDGMFSRVVVAHRRRGWAVVPASAAVDGESAVGRAENEGATRLDGKEAVVHLDGKEGVVAHLDGKEGVAHLDGKEGVAHLDGKEGVAHLDGKEGASHLDGKQGVVVLVHFVQDDVVETAEEEDVAELKLTATLSCLAQCASSAASRAH